MYTSLSQIFLPLVTAASNIALALGTTGLGTLDEESAVRNIAILVVPATVIPAGVLNYSLIRRKLSITGNSKQL